MGRWTLRERREIRSFNLLAGPFWSPVVGRSTYLRYASAFSLHLALTLPNLMTEVMKVSALEGFTVGRELWYARVLNREQKSVGTIAAVEFHTQYATVLTQGA